MGGKERLEGGLLHRLARYRQRLDRLAQSRPMTDPASYFRDKRLLLDYQSSRLTHGLERNVSGQRERAARLAASLDAMSPLKVLGRGYAIAQREDGHVLTSAQGAAPGDRLSLRLSDGSLECRVEERIGVPDGRK